MVLCGSGYQVCRICSSLLHCCSSNSLFQTKCYSIYSLYSSQIPCESPTEFWLVLGPFCCVLAPEHQTPANDGRSIRRADMGRFWSKVEHTFVSGNWADLELSLITSRAAKWKWKIKKRNGEMVTFWSTWQHLWQNVLDILPLSHLTGCYIPVFSDPEGGSMCINSSDGSWIHCASVSN